MTNFSRILNTLTGMHFEDRNQFINSLNRYSLLIIDDLGIERNSDFALEQVFNVIDSRYRSKKPLIITTNLTLSELNNACLLYTSSTVPNVIRQDNAGMNYRERFLFLPSAVNASRKSLSRKKPRENFMKNKWK